MKRKFGITEDNYELLLKKQNYKCAICNRHQTELSRKLAIDHNHKTGKIRGLLCSNCNTGIGNLRDDTFLLYRAAAYLSKFEDEDKNV